VKNDQGFSLIEAVIVIVVIAVLGGIIVSLLEEGLHQYILGKDLTEQNAQARYAMTRFSRELRSIPQSNDVLVLSPELVEFQNGENALVTYCRSGAPGCADPSPNVLLRNGHVVAEGVTQLSIRYLESDLETPATSAEAIYYITFEMTVANEEIHHAYRMTIHPRNFS